MRCVQAGLSAYGVEKVRRQGEVNHLLDEYATDQLYGIGVPVS
jgi:hypothetical protein